MSEPTLLRAYRTPFLLGVLSIAGLVLALVYEGFVDVFALALVATPLVVIARHLLKLRASARETPSHP